MSDDQAPVARVHLAAAFSSILLGTIYLVVMGASPPRLQEASGPIVLGGFVIAIMGTTRMLLAGMAGRRFVGPRVLAWVLLGAAACGAWAPIVAARASSRVGLALSLVWSSALLAHITLVVVTVRGPRLRPPLPETAEAPHLGKLHHLIEGASLFYGAIAVLALPAAYLGRLSMAAAVHAVLAGFVTLTIVAIALHVLPRFAQHRFPARALPVIAPAVVTGPGLLIVGLAWGPSWVFALGTALEAVGLATFCACAAWLALAGRARMRPSLAGYAGACAALVSGGTIALTFLVGSSPTRLVAAHGLANVLGFVGLFCIATSTDIYAPALRAGGKAAWRHGVIVLSLAGTSILVASVAEAMAHDDIVRIALGGYALAVALHLAGAVAAHLRVSRAAMDSRYAP
ncbi:MAG: hypothetical protein WDA16_06640 [Candidatus Thermoplasmatota archaeon]